MAIVTMTASAQVEQGFRMGARVNGGLSQLTGDGSKMTLGYGLGWIAEYNFSPNLFLQSGIGLENIAWKGNEGDTQNVYYAQLPIHIGYRFDMDESYSLFIQAGPYMGCGLFALDNEDYFDSTFGTAKRFDLGVGGRVGVEFSRFQISAGGNCGIIDVNKNVKRKNMSINLGVAYMF